MIYYNECIFFFWAENNPFTKQGSCGWTPITFFSKIFLRSYLHLLFSLLLTSFNDNKVNPVNLGYVQRFPNVFAFSCLLLVVKWKTKTSCRTFSPEAACEVIEAEKHSHVFFEAEQDIWMVLVQFCSKQYIFKW